MQCFKIMKSKQIAEQNYINAANRHFRYLLTQFPYQNLKLDVYFSKFSGKD